VAKGKLLSFFNDLRLLSYPNIAIGEDRMGTKRWTEDDSAELLRLARVLARAAEVFDDLPAAVAWTKAPVAALDNSTPLSLINSERRFESVMNTLGRIEHGVFG
jgi:putative toxin-antitoxin system antitoxin component (TIGR02293 family)